MKKNIENIYNHKEELIKKHLKYLYNPNTSVCLRIQAIEFLYPYINEEMILEKLKYFYEKERDLYIKTILKKAITGTLESYMVTDFNTKRDKENNNSQVQTSKQYLNARELTLLKFSKI